MIQVEKLGVRLGRKQILKEVSFEALSGKVTLLFGPNGAGKTTTLRAISGLLRRYAGSIQIDGISLTERPESGRRQVSYLPQGVRFQPRLTVKALLRFYGRLRHVSHQNQSALLCAWGLNESAGQASGTLSGGMRQRLGLVILLLPDAPVLLLDEPGLSLDPVWREHMKHAVREQAEKGKTVLLATHLVDEWTDLADTTLYLEGGRAVREVLPSEAAAVAKRRRKIHS